MAGSWTPGEAAGQLYVYRDEQGHAAAIARWRVGPNGGLAATDIAHLRVPTKHITRAEIDAYAAQFAQAPTMADYIQRKADEGDDEALAIMERVNGQG